MVKIGKFDVEKEVRLRAFYLESGLSLRLQNGGANDGVRRTVQAFEHVAEHAPRLMPRILDHGTIGESSFLVEETVTGRHPKASGEFDALAPELCVRLRELHRGFGIHECSVSEVLGKKFESRWVRVVEDLQICQAIDSAVRDLIGQDKFVDMSLGHGDLVGTNVLMTSSGPVLIDWEYAGTMPIAFDVAKFHLHCRDRQETARVFQDRLMPVKNRGHYSFTEQLALAHARYVAWSGSARERARVARRSTQLNRLVRKRVAVLAELLDIDPGQR